MPKVADANFCFPTEELELYLDNGEIVHVHGKASIEKLLDDNGHSDVVVNSMSDLIGLEIVKKPEES